MKKKNSNPLCCEKCGQRRKLKDGRYYWFKNADSLTWEIGRYDKWFPCLWSGGDKFYLDDKEDVLEIGPEVVKPKDLK